MAHSKSAFQKRQIQVRTVACIQQWPLAGIIPRTPKIGHLSCVLHNAFQKWQLHMSHCGALRISFMGAPDLPKSPRQ